MFMPLVVLASLLHELAHLAVLRLWGVPVERVRLSAFGAEIRADTRFMHYGKEILCVLAGPAVKILLAFVLANVSEDYLFSGANLLLGVFNLLPVSGLDGGRVLHLLVSWMTDPIRADRLCGAVALVVALALAGAAVWLVLWERSGWFLLLGALGLLLPQLPFNSKGRFASK